MQRHLQAASLHDKPQCGKVSTDLPGREQIEPELARCKRARKHDVRAALDAGAGAAPRDIQHAPYLTVQARRHAALSVHADGLVGSASSVVHASQGNAGAPTPRASTFHPGFALPSEAAMMICVYSLFLLESSPGMFVVSWS